MNNVYVPNWLYRKEQYERMFREDLGRARIEYRKEPAYVSVSIVAEEGGYFCGGIFVPEALNLFNESRIMNGTVKPVLVVYAPQEGFKFNDGEVVMSLIAEAESVRHCVRRILDMILRPLSGIATRTKKAVNEADGYGVKILDTRKTVSGMIEFEKYAVRIGGGYNHRLGRDDGELIKKEDIKIDGGIINAIDKAFERKSHLVSVEVEVETFDELDTVLNDGRVKHILLDNMDNQMLKRAVQRVDAYAAYTRAAIGYSDVYTLEASGIGDRSLKSVAETGVHCISKSSLIDGPKLKMKSKVELFA